MSESSHHDIDQYSLQELRDLAHENEILIQEQSDYINKLEHALVVLQTLFDKATEVATAAADFRMYEAQRGLVVKVERELRKGHKHVA